VSGQLEIVAVEALKLTREERAHLAGRLIASLSDDAELDEGWAAEVERRIAEIEAGRVTPVPVTEAVARARAALE
jgi:putative addiction module component (TIGR02574 family)